MSTSGTFHFTQEPPVEMYSDIQTLNKFSNHQLDGLLEIVFLFVKDTFESVNLSEHLEEFAEQNGINVSGLKGIVKTAINIPSGFSEEKADIFTEKYQANLVDLSRSALSQTLMVNQLVDMEWKFGELTLPQFYSFLHEMERAKANLDALSQ